MKRIIVIGASIVAVVFVIGKMRLAGEGAPRTLLADTAKEEVVKCDAGGNLLDKACGQRETITVGSIADAPKEEIAKFQPFVDYLSSSLENVGIVQGKVVVASSMQEMSNLIQSGKVDLYIDSPFPILSVCKDSGAIPFLRRWKKGVKEYHSVIFVRKDSGIETIEDLKGKTIAFEEDFSTACYFLPKATLMKEGLIPVPQKDAFGSVASDEVGYVFTYDDETTMVWVLENKVSAGAVNHNDFGPLAKGRIGELKILIRTIDVPRQMVCHKPGLSGRLITEIEKVLTNMDKNKEGKTILKAFQKTTKFDKLSENIKEEIKGVKELVKFIEAELIK